MPIEDLDKFADGVGLHTRLPDMTRAIRLLLKGIRETPETFCAGYSEFEMDDEDHVVFTVLVRMHAEMTTDKGAARYIWQCTICDHREEGDDQEEMRERERLHFEEEHGR